MSLSLIPSAASARDFTLNDIIIFEEVVAIARKIYEAKCMGVLEASVMDTFMTSTFSVGEGEIYYQVFKGQIDDRVRELQMNEVINCFKNNGYSITRKSNPLTDGTTFIWELKW